MVWEDLKPRDILTTAAFENAVTAAMALGGSTNAIIHLIAMAGRAGAQLDLDRFDALSRRTPFIANIRPSGQFLMEDFYYAGGLRGAADAAARLLHTDCITVNGRDAGREHRRRDRVQRRRDRDRASARSDPKAASPCCAATSRRDGAVIKHTAAEPRLLSTRARRSCSATTTTSRRASTIPALPVTADSVLVLQNAGPLGGPGMPEWGMLPIPKKLLAQGVRDMVRISDARMSGTSYGACVLHVAPESFVGGPLALVRDGDIIELDVPERRLSLRVDDEELARRRAAWKPPRAAVSARVRPAVCPARHAGQSRLRFRFPRRHGAHR